MPSIRKKTKGIAMAGKKKDSAFKLVLMIFGIIFSVVLVPGLIVWGPGAGALVGVSQAASQEGIESMVKEAKLSENLHTLMMEELEKEAQVDELNPEFWNSLLEDCISVEFIDDLLAEGVDCMYNGTEPQLNVDSVVDGFRSGLDDLAANGFDDIYAACFEGEESKFFSSEFITSVKTDIETDLLEKYSEYPVDSLEDLEEAYDTQFGAGAFEKLFDEEMEVVKKEWNDEFSLEVNNEIDSMAEELEQEINTALWDVTQDPDIRETFDVLNEISANKDKVKLVAYGIVLATVLLLLICFWFGTAGFVVPSVALILGGLLCKLVTLLETPIMDLVKAELATEPGVEEFGFVVTDLITGIMAPFFAEMSKFGYTMIGIGVLLILLAILKAVVTKNMHASEEVM